MVDKTWWPSASRVRFFGLFRFQVNTRGCEAHVSICHSRPHPNITVICFRAVIHPSLMSALNNELSAVSRHVRDIQVTYNVLLNYTYTINLHQETNDKMLQAGMYFTFGRKGLEFYILFTHQQMHFLLNLEKFKIYMKIHIIIASTCFGLRPSSGSLYRAWLKLHFC